jgi:hypothetical protein
MVHPEHGAMHAYDTGEVERLKGYGWHAEEQAPAAKVKPVKVEPEKEPEPVATLKRPLGRPPKSARER